MSIHLQSMAWNFSLSNSKYKQKSNIKLVLIKLCDNASDEGYCWPSIGRIAKECELSKRSVIDQLNKLKEIGLIDVEHRFKNNEQTSNGYHINIEMLGRGELLAPTSESYSLPQCTDCTQNHNLTIIESSEKNTKQFSSENRISISNLDSSEFKMCKAAMQILSSVKEECFSNIYTGTLLLNDWIVCEKKLRETCDTKEDVETMLGNIYAERKMFKKKSVSLPYLLMSFFDADEFSHVAINYETWLE